jgi:hypothetical protein
MSGPHDMGGSPSGPINKSQHEVQDWERLADAVTILLDKKGIKTTDEHRRAQEDLEDYASPRYYERWIAATEALLIEKSILTQKEVDTKSKELQNRWDSQ